MGETEWTRGARTVLCLARESAALLGHSCVGSEHLLLGLVREEDGLAAQLLAGAGLTSEGLEEAVAARTGRGDPGTGPVQGLTPRCRRSVGLALEEQERLGHRALGTEDRGAVRFSWSYFNTAAETDAAAEAVRTLAEEAL